MRPSTLPFSAPTWRVPQIGTHRSRWCALSRLLLRIAASPHPEATSSFAELMCHPALQALSLGKALAKEMVWCRRPIGAHGAFACVVCGWHWRSCASGERYIEREVHTAAPKVRPHARACAHTRPRHRRGVGERPHVRGSAERTAALAVAKTKCRGGQTRWPWRAEWPLQGIPSEKAASGGCGPISTNHVVLFGLSYTRLGLVSTLHLALAVFRQGAPCFGHCPFLFV